MSSTPMIAPDGTTGDIPTTRVQDAVGAGFKMATVMTSPDGRLGYVPSERAADARKAGFKIAPVGNMSNVGTVDKPFSSDAGTPVNLITGEGGLGAAAHQAQQDLGAQGEQMKGIPVGVAGVLPGITAHAPASIAEDKRAYDAQSSPVPSSRNPVNIPQNMRGLMRVDEQIPSVAGAAAAMTPSAVAGFSDVAEDVGQGIKGAARKVFLDPVTGEPTITPTTIAKRVLRAPEEPPPPVYGPTRVNPEQIKELNPPPTPMGPTRVNPEQIQTELSPPMTPYGPTRMNPQDIQPDPTAPRVIGGTAPLRPLIGSEADWNAYDQQMGILEPEAKTSGMYHAARGSATKRLNLQQRMGAKFDPYSPTR